MGNKHQKAATTTAESRRVPIISEMMRDLRMVGDLQLSPDGQRIACVLREEQAGLRKLGSRVWKVEAEGGEPRPLLSGKKSSAYPRWSPDSKWLAFLARDDGEQDKPQLYLVPAEGGEIKPGGSLPGGIDDPVWSPDSQRIAFVSSADETSADPKIFVPGSGNHRRLWSVRPDDALPQPVTPDGMTVWEHTWSPDCKQFAIYYSSEPGANSWYHAQIGLVPATGGAVQQVTQFEPISVQARALAWSPDGTRLAYVGGRWSDPGRGAGEIYLLDLASGETRNLTPGIDYSLAWCKWFPDGQRLLFTAIAGVTHQIGVLDVSTGAISWLERDFVMRWDQPTLSVSSDFTTFLAVHSTSQQPSDAYLGTIERNDDQEESIAWKRLTRFNTIPEETWAWACSERIQYPSSDGAIIHALFTPPILDKRGTPPPLFIDVHGGPSGAEVDNWGPGYPQVFPSVGYAVLRVNYRGSWGNGVSFADTVLGDMGGKDLQDILAGVDYLIAQGRIDGERVAIGGWSNGGFLAAWAVTQTTRFKAAVMGAGICDWHNQHAETNIPSADVLLMAADPLEQPEVYRQHSPLTFAAQVTTPTLILHGENDPAVPVAQAYAFYRALYERQVPVEMAIYPREGHGLSELAHIIESDQHILRWLEKYLG